MTATVAQLPHSIPTEYNGRTFRSRFEADLALALDQWDVTWEYEPRSILLAQALHFRPDFYLPVLALWVELRGYVSETGEAQIREFSRSLSSGSAFLVVRAGAGATLYLTLKWANATRARASLDRKEFRLFCAAFEAFRLQRNESPLFDVETEGAVR